MADLLQTAAPQAPSAHHAYPRLPMVSMSLQTSCLLSVMPRLTWLLYSRSTLIPPAVHALMPDLTLYWLRQCVICDVQSPQALLETLPCQMT